MFACEARVSFHLCSDYRADILESRHSSNASSTASAPHRSNNTTVISLHHDRLATFHCPDHSALDVAYTLEAVFCTKPRLVLCFWVRCMSSHVRFRTSDFRNVIFGFVDHISVLGFWKRFEIFEFPTTKGCCQWFLTGVGRN
jgi:hypothetical protein